MNTVNYYPNLIKQLIKCGSDDFDVISSLDKRKCILALISDITDEHRQIDFLERNFSVKKLSASIFVQNRVLIDVVFRLIKPLLTQIYLSIPIEYYNE